jgi:hypothetical protein
MDRVPWTLQTAIRRLSGENDMSNGALAVPEALYPPRLECSRVEDAY